MTVSNQSPHKVKLSGKEKWLFVSLLILQVPMAVIFIPLAAVLILPGFLAPFGLACFAIGTKPFTMAMKLLSDQKSESDVTINQAQID